jgi:hypothetical protein
LECYLQPKGQAARNSFLDCAAALSRAFFTAYSALRCAGVLSNVDGEAVAGSGAAGGRRCGLKRGSLAAGCHISFSEPTTK